MLSRIWARLDNAETEAPLAMLTLGWDSRLQAMVPGSARLWAVSALSLSRGEPRRRLYIGLADVCLPVDNADYVIRVVALHRCIRQVAGRGRLGPVEEHDGAQDGKHDGKHDGEGRRRGLVLGQPLLAHFASGAVEEDAAGKAVEPGQPWPQPQPLVLRDLLSHRAHENESSWLDGLANEALTALAESEEAAAAASAAWLASAAPLLRKRRPLRGIQDCVARPGPAVRASMSTTSPGSDPAAASTARRTLCFAAGSCRYPGTPFERDRADASLELLEVRAGRADGPAFVIFSGDQIYADATAGVFEVQGRREKVAARYEGAFSAEAFRRLARRLPLYMTADDHEITEGWSQPRAQAPHLKPFEVHRNTRLHEWAAQLFAGYQRMHGPPPQLAAENWFQFEVGGVSFFMMDTRFERGLGPAGAAPPLCTAEQLESLVEWLRTTPALAPKFIVSGSVFAPGLAEWEDVPPGRSRSDTWQGYARERAAVAHAVIEAGADNIVFLSGDYHCAAIASIQWMDPATAMPLPLRAWSVVTPSLYAPFRFANSRAEDVLREEEIVDPASPARVVARCRARAFDRSGFALISVGHGGGEALELQVEFVDPHVGDGPESMAVSVADAAIAGSGS
jgi:hypothetical protein